MNQEENNMEIIAKPIKHMTIEFDTPKQEQEFINYAHGKISIDKRSEEIREMVKYHKRAKERRS